MTTEELSEELGRSIVTRVEVRTADEGMTLEQAAEVCRSIAAELRDRAAMFEHEARAADREDGE